MGKLLKKIRARKGFTLIEMMVAMSIFVVFLGILISSYTDIVKSQREANDYRVLYSEARRAFDKMTEEIRNGWVFYDSALEINVEYKKPNDVLVLVSDGGNRKVEFHFEEMVDEEGESYDSARGNIMFTEEGFDPVKGGLYENFYPLIISEKQRAYVTEFSVYVSPVGDPYKTENIFADGLQFQPKVTVFASFEMVRRKGGDPFVVDLQTTVSSRLYTQALPVMF
jgi:prepilin-type N-terminal cleavage/methylation domain-containing protein